MPDDSILCSEGSGNRFRPLDGLRGTAALMVVCYHYIFLKVLFPSGTIVYTLRAPLKLFWSGVDLFFVLSGFLITTILIRRKSSPNYFGNFYIRIICRILPVYFIVLLTFYISINILNEVDDLVSRDIPLWTYPLFVQNIAMWSLDSGGARWMAPTWSLAVEEQFYIVIPFIILWMSYKKALVTLIILAAIAPMLRLMFPGTYSFMMTPFRTDTLMFGSILAYGMQYSRIGAFSLQNIKILRMILAALFSGIIVMMFRREWFGPFDFTWISAFYTVLILFLLINGNGILARTFCNRLLVWFGGISYAIYMFHEAILGLTYYAAKGTSNSTIRNLDDVMLTASAFAITSILAVLSYRYVEAPARRWARAADRRLFSASRSSPPLEKAG